MNLQTLAGMRDFLWLQKPTGSRQHIMREGARPPLAHHRSCSCQSGQKATGPTTIPSWMLELAPELSASIVEISRCTANSFSASLIRNGLA
jgi:hypothetical protein